ncbi:hypothetical protein P879_02573 [Paragonimus westermani]|uniref:Ion transport domain-containing protein n=1 Tax=Paragonimus westermani TaxID=34504 RepID=A0A8T0DAH3_9TREM|nr:hypothetical protein P879_02573 [Paragonimus westermani]
MCKNLDKINDSDRRILLNTEERWKLNKIRDAFTRIIRTSDPGNFTAFLEKHYDYLKSHINVRDDNSLTLLHHAVCICEVPIIETLVVELGANVNVQDKDGLTALHMVVKHVLTRAETSRLFDMLEDDDDDDDTSSSEKCDHKSNEEEEETVQQWASRVAHQQDVCRSNTDQTTVHHELIHFLISKGANINMTDNNGNTPLHYAASRNNVVAARQLIADNATIECKDVEGLTPLMTAAQKNNISVMKVLLEAGADYTAEDVFGNNVLHHCRSRESCQTIELVCSLMLAKEEPNFLSLVNWTNQDNDTPLHQAARNNATHVITYLLNLNICDPTVSNYSGDTCLHLIARGNGVEMVPMLITHGADINAKGNNEESPLFVAVRFGEFEMVNVLIENGANVNLINAYSMTPLMVACEIGDVKIATVLLNNLATLKCADEACQTALTHAIKGNHLDVVQCLLASDSDGYLLNSRDTSEDTAVHYAARIGSTDILQSLFNAGEISNKKNDRLQAPLHVAAINGHVKVVELLLDLDEKSASEKDEDGNTALHHAAEFGHPEIVSLILRRFSAIHLAKNDMGRTPLACAANSNQVNCVKVFLNRPDEEVDTKDKSKLTPLFLACKGGHVEVVTLLLSRGADPAQCASTEHAMYPGWNALNAAVEGKHLECTLAIINSPRSFKALKNRTINMNGYLETPFSQMVRNLPEAAKLLMDRCIDRSDLPLNHPHYSVTFNFVFLEVRDEDKEDHRESGYSLLDCKKRRNKHCEKLKTEHRDKEDETLLPVVTNSQDEKNQTAKLHAELKNPLYVMLEHGRKDLLQHELVNAFITYKWIRLIGPYTLNILLYVLLVILFTTFMLSSKPPYMLLMDKNATIAELCNDMETKGIKAYGILIAIPKYGLMVLAVLNLIKEFAQLKRSKLAYFNLENLIEVSIYVLAILTTVDTNRCMRVTGLREHWQWQTGTTGLTLAWVNLLLFIQHSSRIGIYVGMFTLVFRNLCELLVVFSPFIVAFMLAFHLLLFNQFEFMNIGNAFSKIIAMIAGEVDFVATVLSRYEADAGSEVLVHYEAVTYVLFVIFIAVMAIALTNMLTGVAVGDVNDIQGQATISRLRMTIQTLFDAKGLLIAVGIRWSIPQTYHYKPNIRGSFMDQFFNWLYTAGRQSQKQSDDEEEENMEVANQLGELEDKLSDMEKKLDRIFRQLANNTRQNDCLANSSV